MSFKDIIKKSVLDGFAQSDLSVDTIVVTLGLAALFALYVYGVYRFSTRSTFYSRDFNKTLALMPVVTAAILLALQSSLAIGLGMVGALSIVRFRNAVKDPMDLFYLFWSISLGIVCGARLYELAAIASAIITLMVVVLDLIPSARPPYLLVLNSSDKGLETALTQLLRSHTKAFRIKSRNLTQDGLDMIVELRTRKGAQLVTACAALPGVESVNLLTHDGEVRY